MNQPEETGLIQKYLAPLAGPSGLGLRDDAACYTPTSGHDLIITTDTIVEGVHFLPSDTPFDIAIKAITVNLSDLVAKGADPVGYQVALSLPQKPTEEWFAEFARGLGEQASGLLMGGDLTVSKGSPLTISVTALGEVPTGKMVRRRGAKIGDDIYVAGHIGTSALGLKCALDPVWANGSGLLPEEIKELLYYYTSPRVVEANIIGPLIRTYATASLDVSDGLAIDLERLCSASNVGAKISVKSVPLHYLTRRMVKENQFTMQDVVTGGDDYVALFTVPSDLTQEQKSELNENCYHIGKIIAAKKGVSFSIGFGRSLSLGGRTGYDHFSDKQS